MKIAQQAHIPQPDRSRVAVVVVLYNPSADDLSHLAELEKWGVQIFVVINAIAHDGRAEIHQGARLSVITNPCNLGLAFALNQGVAAAFAASADFVLMLDQDSRPSPAMLDRLVAEAIVLIGQGRRLACVGPILRDRKAVGTSVGAQPPDSGPRTFATSGTMLTRRAWEVVGPMWEALFIDGIDHEWCFRARAKGFETVSVASAVMEHDMGEAAVNIFGRFRPIHRSPFRHYFIVRNTLWLARKSYIPLRWRIREIAKLTYRIPAYALLSSDRVRSAGNIIAALVDGIFRSTSRQPG